jgi:hypothetical protein
MFVAVLIARAVSSVAARARDPATVAWTVNLTASC